MRRLSGREKKLAAITAILGVFAAVYGLLIEPLAGRWKNINEQIEVNTVLLMRNSRLIKMQDSLQEEYVQCRDFMAVDRGEEELAGTLGKIEEISRKSSCRIVNIKPFAARDRDNYRIAVFDITAEGRISDFSRFLYEMERSRPPLRVKQFIVSPKTGSPGTLKGVFRVKKIVFTRPGS